MRQSLVRNYIRLICLFICAGNLVLSAQNGLSIRHIYFSGNDTLSSERLLEQMQLYETDNWKRVLLRKKPAIYDDLLLQSDLERLEHLYQTEGFLWADLQLDTIQRSKSGKRLNLFIRVRENDPVGLGEVRLLFSDSVDSAVRNRMLEQAERKGFLPKSGSRFRDENILLATDALEKYYTDAGFVYATVSNTIHLDTTFNSADVFFDIESGNRARAGTVRYAGFDRIDTAFVSSRLAWKKDSIFRYEALDETRVRLNALQLFRMVSITPELDRERPMKPLNIQLKVEELPAMSGKLGVGWGTEDRFRAFVDWTYRGLWGKASRVNVYAKHSALDPYYLSVRWIQPYFLLPELSLTINPYMRRQAEPGYQTALYGLSIPLIYEPTTHWSLAFSYYLDRVRQFAEAGVNPEFSLESSDLRYNKSGVQASVRYSNARPMTNPTKGYSLLLGSKLNGYAFGSDFDFWKSWLDLRTYQPLNAWVIALRGMAGWTFPSAEEGFVPVEDRFYAGGSNSVRGWKRAELGPKRNTGTPLGGNQVIEMNVELRRHLFWILEAAAFMDAGNVWNAVAIDQVPNLAYSVGGGLRLKTPIGPVRLDVSMPVWNEKRSMEFFINVGQAF